MLCQGPVVTTGISLGLDGFAYKSLVLGRTQPELILALKFFLFKIFMKFFSGFFSHNKILNHCNNCVIAYSYVLLQKKRIIPPDQQHDELEELEEGHDGHANVQTHGTSNGAQQTIYVHRGLFRYYLKFCIVIS